KELYLEENQLTMLPKQIAALKQLARLSLKGNQFPSEEKERIQRLLPKCNISFKLVFRILYWAESTFTE
ncbi:hypothetical protein LEP1GSC158_4092, partial [Leptospira interrogans serovar Zanoni str. LT2156]